MKTILIAHNYSQNSFAYMSHSLAQYLASKGNRVVFISHKPYFEKSFSEDISSGVLIVYSWPSRKRPTSIKDVLWFIKIYLKYKPNIVISHFVNVNITVTISKILSLGRVTTLPYYHTLSSAIITDSGKITLFNRVLKIRKKILYHFFCDTVICPSDLAKEDLSRYFGIDKGFKVLNPMQDRFELKKVLSENELSIVYLGRIDNTKGVIDMITAFNSYCLEFPETKITIKIAGDGSQILEMLEMIRQNSRIKYIGSLEYCEVDSYLSGAHYTIIPSKFDNLPTVGLESLMNQTPLLISNSTGLSDELTDGFECYKFDSNADSLLQLFDKVESTVQNQKQMGSNARSTFLKKFCIQSYHQSMEKFVI